MSTDTEATDQAAPIASDRRLKDGRRRVRWQCHTHPEVSAVITASSDDAAFRLAEELWMAHVALDHAGEER